MILSRKFAIIKTIKYIKASETRFLLIFLIFLRPNIEKELVRNRGIKIILENAIIS